MTENPFFGSDSVPLPVTHPAIRKSRSIPPPEAEKNNEKRPSSGRKELQANNMRNTKAMKETHIFFDEESDTIQVSTFNTGLKKRARQSAEKHPVHCRIVSDDKEYEDMTFEISKKCFCFRFISPCSEERKEQMSRYAKDHETIKNVNKEGNE